MFLKTLNRRRSKICLKIFLVTFSLSGFILTGASLSCDSGSLSTTCRIQSNQNVDSQNIQGSGSLIVESGNKLYTGSSSGSEALIDMDGPVIVEGELEGNFDVSSESNITFTSTSLYDGNQYGYSGGCGGSSGNGPGGGSGNNNGAASGANRNYGSEQEPYRLGSGGGGSENSAYATTANVCGGDGGGTLNLTTPGELLVDGTLQSKGGNGGCNSNTGGAAAAGGGGSGGSIYLEGLVKGSGSIDLSGGSGGSCGGKNAGNGNSGRVAIYSLASYSTSVSNYYTYYEAGGDLTVDVRDIDNNNVSSQTVRVYRNNSGSSYDSKSTNSNGEVTFSQIRRGDALGLGSGKIIDDIYATFEGTKAKINKDLTSPNEWLNLTLYNQTLSTETGEKVRIKRAGTQIPACELETNKFGDTQCGLTNTELYDVNVKSNLHKSEINFNNVRSPDKIEAGKNQNFVPESTRSGSKKFSAGHVIPAQTFVTRPFRDFDVVNVSVEKSLKSDYRLISDVLVRKFNVDSPAAYSSWSNRQTVKIQEIYDRDWDDSGGQMNDAWGTINFNPRGFQNSDCSDVRLTDADGNLQDFTIIQCSDSKVSLEFNVPVNALQGKNFYLYYGNAGASSAESSVERPSEFRDADFDTGVTAQEETYHYSNAGGSVRDFNISIPQNVDFTVREMELNGTRSKPNSNTMPDTLDQSYQANSGMKIRTKRDLMLTELTVELASTTVDTEVIIRNLNSSTVEHVESLPDDGQDTYRIDLKNSGKQRTGENTVLEEGNHYLIMVRDGQAMRRSTPISSRPMYNLNDVVLMHQNFNCNNDGTSCSEGDYPTLVKGMDTIDPDLPTNLNITLDGAQIYNGPNQLEDDVVDLSDDLSSEDWRIGDPLDDPKLHDFKVESESDGNLTMDLNTEVEFEHPVTQVSKDASSCSVQPDSPTYFYFDFTDCDFLERVNVTEGNWFRVDYRFRVPGPEDFGGSGSVNTYNITDTKVRFNVLTETEEFNP